MSYSANTLPLFDEPGPDVPEFVPDAATPFADLVKNFSEFGQPSVEAWEVRSVI